MHTVDTLNTVDTFTETLPRLNREDLKGPQPHLVLAFNCDRPREEPLRFSLAGLKEVRLGRGPSRAHSYKADGDTKALVIQVPDRRVSGAHARLQRERGRWVLYDRSSKNGSFVNGLEKDVAPLEDGDVIELGHTFFVYRTGTSCRLKPVITVAESGAPDEAMHTLNPSLGQQFEKLADVARSSASIVILGETGTGKEVAARAVHRLSGRSGGFVAVNCGALPPTLASAELFGYRKGAFTGAVEDRPGLVRAADGGTLFLDEIGDLPLELQATLLRVLQEREVTPVGDTKPVPVDFRLVVATNRDLEAMAKSGKFREDLLARLESFMLALPPLRDRREDIGALIAVMLERQGEGAPGTTFDFESARALFLYDWPHNIRELEQRLTSAVALARDGVVGPEHLPSPLRSAATPKNNSELLDEKEQEMRRDLEDALAEHEGNVTAAAKQIGKSRVQVHRWIKRLGIDVHEYRR